MAMAMPTPASTSTGGLQGVIVFVVPLLQVRELLSLEQVSKSFLETIRQDASLWRKIVILSPLNRLVTDEALSRLISRSRESLHTLQLHRCHLLTGTKLVETLANCPKLVELAIPNCPHVSYQHVMQLVLRLSNKYGASNLRRLRLSGTRLVSSFPVPEFEVLLHHLRAPSDLQEAGTRDGLSLPPASKRSTEHGSPPKYYHEIMNLKETDVFENSDMVIDLDICPLCNLVRRVYDCPSPTCRRQPWSGEECRGCASCIKRCRICGKCCQIAPNSSELSSVCSCQFCDECLVDAPLCIQCDLPSCPSHLPANAAQICSAKNFLCFTCNFIY